MKFRIALAATASLALAACGSADDASTEAEADTVEIPANEALEGVAAEPVVDESAMVEEVEDVEAEAAEQEQIEEAGDEAAETAAAAADAMVEE